MKRILLGVLLLINISYADLNYVKKMVDQMQQNEVVYEDDILYIKLLNESRINYDIIYSIVKNSYCSDLWLNGEKSFLKSFKNIKGVVVLNKHAHQSIIYKGKFDDCKKIGTLPTNLVNMEIASNLIFATGSNLEKELKNLK